MTDDQPIDVGAYCRQVEAYLTRSNAGHLVRIVGPGFELVRGWAEEGVPLSVVYRGIDLKVERHRAGNAARPLRIEFCEGDVRAVYEHWRRAVGLAGRAGGDGTESTEPAEDRKRPSLSKHIDRAIERLGRASGRLDVPEPVRESIGRTLDELASLRDAAKKARGEARDPIEARLRDIDRALGDDARRAAPQDTIVALEGEATQDLAAFRARLPRERWQAAVAATVDRLLRDRWGLPTLDL